ncbi:MAG: hypothetical protein ABR903_00010 [Thermodesulfovibrionales bacterium]|jgi:hypothetical protein
MENFSIGLVVYHLDFGIGRIVNMEEDRITVSFIKAGVKSFLRSDAETELSETPFDSEEEDKDTKELKDAIRAVLREEGLIGTTPLADKWRGGELILKPVRPELQQKAVPIETFFHKIVMIRNQLRMLEQNINSFEKLSDAEKVDLQQYITRCYGSLTTFNVLFADKNDWFVGSKKDQA